MSTALFSQENNYPEDLHIYPYLQYSTPTSIIIKWETINPVIGTVRFSSDDTFSGIKSDTIPVKLHEIKLTGLTPATKYQYRVSYHDITLEPASFTTAPVPGTTNWRLVAYGDNRTYPETHKRISEQILKLNPSIIIHSGDLVSNGDVYEQWKEQYFDPMKGLAENIAVFPSLGNHEINSHHYYDYMSVPDENGESFYSFDYGNAHFIALNSNENEAPFELDSKQTQWLIEDLKEHADATWKIVFFHHPLFRCHPTRGIEPQRWVWQDIFEEYGVDLVVNGHDHYYQRTYAIGNYKGKPSRGIYHLVSGGGGAPNYPIVPKIHAASRRSVHHLTVLDFQDDRIVGRAIDDMGNVFDAFLYDKQAENSPEEFISYEIYKIERDLANAIYRLPIQEYKNDVVYRQKLEVENPFRHPLKMTFSWKVSDNWRLDPPKTEILNPGESIKIDMNASGTLNTIDPLPVAQLKFQTPEGTMAFKNNKIEFHPIKIGKRKVVKPMEIEKSPFIDGDLSDSMWNKNRILSDFTDIQSGIPAQKTEVAVSYNKKRNSLYIAGKLEASVQVSNSGEVRRDHRYILRNDNIKVHIGVDNEVYTYVVNPKGALLDTQDISVFWNRDAIPWNSRAIVAAKPAENGWHFEMEIPLDDLKITRQKTSINFSRNDLEFQTKYEFSRTFGLSRLDHRVPMFDVDWYAVDQFARLELK